MISPLFCAKLEVTCAPKMYFFIDEIEFEKIDDNETPIEITDEESEKIGNYIARTVWEADDMTSLVKKIEKAVGCTITVLTFRSEQTMPT